jgi:hypothetical protein
MVQQNVAMAQLVEDAGRFPAQHERLGREGLELQVRPLDVAVEKHQPRQIDGAFSAKNLALVELEVHAQPLHNLGVGVAFDLQPHRVALAPVMQLHADRLQERPRFFLLEVEVRVARHAEGRRSQHRVAAVHAGQMLLDHLLQEHVVVMAVRAGQVDEPGQRARHRHHAQHLRPGAAALRPQQQSQAKRLVQHPRKGMRGIDRNRRQQRIHLALEVAAGKLRRLLAEFVPRQQPDALLAQFRRQLLVPAPVLRGHKLVNLGGQHRERFGGAQPVVAGLAVAVFNALHQAGLADLHVFIEVRAGNGQELHAFQQRVRRVFGLFEHTPVELHPGVVPAVK